MLKHFERKKALSLVVCFVVKETNRFHFAVRLFSNRSQKTSKCGKNINDTRGYASCATYLFLPHFDVICDLLLNRRTQHGIYLLSRLHAGRNCRKFVYCSWAIRVNHQFFEDYIGYQSNNELPTKYYFLLTKH